MSLLTWEQKYSVDVEEMDEDHRKLLDLINSAHEIMVAGRTHSELGSILDQLLQYTVTHFSKEEKYMEQIGYPELEDQKHKHRFFTSKIEEIKEQHQMGMATASIKVIQFLMDWLVNHIIVVDKKYTNYFHKAGLK